MPIRDVLAALVVVFVWGVTFVVIKIGVETSPPLLLSALRFTFAAIPAVFFIRPPKTKAAYVIAYGVTLGVVQFGLLFIAMRLGLPTGLASLLVQAQVFFTIGFAVLALRQRPSRVQLIGVIVGCLGIAVIGVERATGAAILPFLIVLVAAAGWGAANVIGMKVAMVAREPVDMLSFTIWAALAAPLPLFALSFGIEGHAAVEALLHPTWLLGFVVLFLAGPAHVFGFGIWSRLLSLHPAAAVTPFALLVPVFGILSARIAFAEPMSLVEWIGGALVLSGLAINVFGGRLMTLGRSARLPAGPPMP